jgi:hypothetical protein
MKILSIVTTMGKIAILAFLLPMSLLVRAQAVDSPAVTNLLDEVKMHAWRAKDEAATLESYTRSKLSSKSHGVQLNAIKDHVNDLLADCSKMSAMRDEGSPWQQEAIDRVNPLLHEIADHLSTTIEYLNNNQTRIHMQPFKDYVHANYQLISKAHDLLADFVDYGRARAQAASLEKELSLPGLASEGK